MVVHLFRCVETIQVHTALGRVDDNIIFRLVNPLLNVLILLELILGAELRVRMRFQVSLCLEIVHPGK